MDFFGARYYGSTQGRFTSPDPLLSSGRPDNPQTWNHYSYTLNNPLAFVDPTGLFTIGSNVSDDDRERIVKAYNKLNDLLGKLKEGSKAYKSVQRSLARLGKPGEANGVVVTVGTVKDPSAAADTDPNTVNKGTVTITFNKDTFSGKSAEVAGIELGHEGVHADDIFNTYSHSKSMADFLKTWDSNDVRYQTEYDAHFVDAGGYRTFFPNQLTNYGTQEFSSPKDWGIPLKGELWNPSWKELDEKQIESKQGAGIQIELETSKHPHYGRPGYGLKRPANFQP